ncbi:DUF7331 family protein [Natronobeatus ordinarius]|uniref:DUF7331 family protein n=1 Tax=Natronobeatus ordinarius TaxID=2963433 RepID=UPI0020CCF398|nr:hypothetical protein [Natronobeatus ordinarius]
MNDDTTDGIDGRDESSGIDTIESYEADGCVVFYDAENPLAWVEATRTMRLEDLA